MNNELITKLFYYHAKQYNLEIHSIDFGNGVYPYHAQDSTIMMVDLIKTHHISEVDKIMEIFIFRYMNDIHISWNLTQIDEYYHLTIEYKSDE